MHIQLNKVLVFIALLGFVFTSCTGEAIAAGSELRDIQEIVKSFISSFSVKDTLENMSPLTIIGLCVATVVLAILFRGLIFFMMVFSILIIMFGGTEKATSYLREKFSFAKVKPGNEKYKN